MIFEKQLIENLTEIIQSNVIELSEDEILDLFQLWKKENEKEVKWIFNRSLISPKQFLPDNPYLLGIDFPNWFGNFSSNKRIMIVGIDPLRNEAVFKQAKADKNEEVIIGTPYALHSEKVRNGKTRPYWEFIKSLSKTNFVYLTDIYKTFFYTNTTKTERSYDYYRKNIHVLDSRTEILEKEINLVKPDIIITLGKESFVQLTGEKCNKLSRNINLNKSYLKRFPEIPIIPMTHLSGATRKQNLEDFLAANDINSSKFDRRYQYGLGYAEIIKKFISNITTANIG